MNRPATILLVDDDASVREVCHEALADCGHLVVEAASVGAAIAEIRPDRFDAAVVDLRLEDGDGMEIVSALRAADPETCVIVMTGYADLDSAVSSVRQGVYDYIRKPFDADDLARAVGRGLERRHLAAENARLMAELRSATQRLVAHKRRLEQKIEVATEELGSLVELGRQLAAATDDDALLAAVLERACALTGAGGGQVLHADGDAPLTVRAQRGDCAADATIGTAAEARRLAAEAARIGRPVLDNELLDRTPGGPLLTGHPSSVLVVPIVLRGLVTGMLVLYDRSPGPFTAQDADLVNVLALQAAGGLAGRPAGLPGGREAEDAPESEFVAMEDLLDTW